MRSSTSLPKAAPPIARSASGRIDPASIAPRMAVSKAVTDGALSERSISTAMITGIAASTAMMKSRQRPESWRRVRR